jgi:hypothetical protein
VSQTGPSWTTPSYRAHQFASALRAHRCQRVTLRSVPEHAAPLSTSTRTACAALPQRPSLRSGLCCPDPSSLIRPHPPHSRAHRDFAALRLIRHALAVRLRLGDPRLVPCFRCPLSVGMSSSQTPGSSLAASAQFLRQRRWPSPRCHRLGTPEIPHHPLRVGQVISELNHGSLSLRPVDLLAPLSDRTRLSLSPRGLLRPGFQRIGHPLRRRI